MSTVKKVSTSKTASSTIAFPPITPPFNPSIYTERELAGVEVKLNQQSIVFFTYGQLACLLEKGEMVFVFDDPKPESNGYLQFPMKIQVFGNKQTVHVVMKGSSFEEKEQPTGVGYGYDTIDSDEILYKEIVEKFFNEAIKEKLSEYYGCKIKYEAKKKSSMLYFSPIRPYKVEPYFQMDGEFIDMEWWSDKPGQFIFTFSSASVKSVKNPQQEKFNAGLKIYPRVDKFLSEEELKDQEEEKFEASKKARVFGRDVSESDREAALKKRKAYESK